MPILLQTSPVDKVLSVPTMHMSTSPLCIKIPPVLSVIIVLGIPFVLTLTYVVFFPGLASFIFWIKGISLIGANRAGVFLHVMPIFGAIMAMVIFKEKFMYYHILGAIFIIAGITLSNKKRKND